MVPVEVRAFGLLAVCVILLAVALFVQWMPARSGIVARPAMLLVLAVVVALAIAVLVTTSQ